MKLISYFKEFLEETVNLNQDRLNQLNDSSIAIKNFIRSAEWGPRIRRFYEQGSLAHSTIIKPIDNKEFDADIMVMVDPVDDWNASDYVRELGAKFSESGLYKDKTIVGDVCVTITYVGQKRIDITPCVVDRDDFDKMEVCHRRHDEFILTEPVAYTEWLKACNSYSGNNSFRKVTRLLKYVRDIKKRFTCPSVLLTTLIGMQIEEYDKDTDAFFDTPTTLQTVIGRLDDFLQENEEKPEILNPSLESEDFSAFWNDIQYKNFRNFIHKYRGWIDEAMADPSLNTSVEKWRRVFGDEFAKRVNVQKVEKSAMDELTATLNESAAHPDSIVDFIRDFGIRLLPTSFKTVKHMSPPKWPTAHPLMQNINIIARYFHTEDALVGTKISSGETLPAGGAILFDARINRFTPVPNNIRVEWRITNTGEQAIRAGDARGEFYESEDNNTRWETLSYRGIHFAEAFFIRKDSETLIGQSEPFYVVIR